MESHGVPDSIDVTPGTHYHVNGSVRVWDRCYAAIQVDRREDEMDGLTLFGFVAVSLMLVFYALEKQSHWFILAFSVSCVLASAYGFMQGAWPFGLVEAVWSVVAFRRWWLERRSRRQVP